MRPPWPTGRYASSTSGWPVTTPPGPRSGADWPPWPTSSSRSSALTPRPSRSPPPTSARPTTRERARVERLLERGALAQKAIAGARAVEDANTGLRDLRERTERVAAVSDGQGPGKIGLETWVLAGELERVTEAANVHLARMTNGRYQLQRTDDAGHRAKQAGLDLTVFDSHTGRARPPATLSGGEQFQASLALALGLADVVSLGGVGSGRRFEALFVDEGFGSLDPDALDQAVDALHHIHASGRMVGVITHVEAMKQQLPTGVEVVVRRDGRGSTLVTH